MKIYTGGGDKGKTSLFSGERVEKHSLRIDSYGDLDELNSFLGAVISLLPQEAEELKADLLNIQVQLFLASAWLATTPDSSAIKFLEKIPETVVTELEGKIDELTASLPVLKEFILPGGSPVSSWLHVVRTVCRRCERKVVRLQEEEGQNSSSEVLEIILKYLNRLSDYFFVAARYANKLSNTEEHIWQQGR